MGATGYTTTISSAAPATDRIATIPALSADDTFTFIGQAQTLTNKTFTDNSSLFQDDLDNTKKLAFQISNVSGSSTVTLTAPNQSGTIAVGATTPISLNATTGVISCPTCLTSSIAVTSVNNVTGAITIVGGGINGVTTNGQTITVTGTEADTLQSVTTRAATSTDTLTLSNSTPLILSSTTPAITVGTLDVSGATLKFQDSHAGTANTLMTLQDLNGTGSTGKLTVDTADISNLSAASIGAFSATGNITGDNNETISGFTTINGATISSGTLSGGTLSGGTYTDSGLSVTGDYTATIGNTRSFTISDGTNALFTVADGGSYGDITRVRNMTANGTITFSGLTTDGIVTATSGVLVSQATVTAAQGGTGGDHHLQEMENY